jgi:hypothetical protein
MSEDKNRSGACHHCSLSHVSCADAFAEYHVATPIIERTQSDSAFARYYEATPIIGQTESQKTKVKLMKKQMEVIKAKREGKKSCGGDEKPSELLKAVREDLERLDVK